MELNWGQVIEHAAGVILGGGITIMGLWAKERFDTKRTAQIWFEQTYITEGIERALSHLKIKQIHLTQLLASRRLAQLRPDLLSGMKETILRDEASEAFPLESVVRLEILLKIPDITASIVLLNQNTLGFGQMMPEQRSLVFMEQTITHLEETSKCLGELREALLTLRIKRKSDTYLISTEKKVMAPLAKLRTLNEEWLSNKPKRSDLIRQGR